VTFLWSDAWILQAVALAAQEEPARLDEVIAAADAVNHAIPTAGELHGAFVRLTQAGFIQEVGGRFSLGPQVAPESRLAITSADAVDARRHASRLLAAEEWTPGRNVPDPRSLVVYPGLTDDRLRAAERAYHKKGPR
jgi:hypothetical protein